MDDVKRLLFWILFPFVIPQAILTRKHAPRFSAAKGPQQGSCGNGRELKLLAVGDSIIAGVGADKIDDALVGRTVYHLSNQLNCRVRWYAKGETGITTDDLINRVLPELKTEPADFIIISIGVNDVTSLTRSNRWRNNLKCVFKMLKNNSPNAVIAFAGMPPLKGFPLLPEPLRSLIGMRADAFDRISIELIKDISQIVHVPISFDTRPEKFAKDGYHPSQEGYDEFGRVMADALAGQYQNPP